METLLQTYPDGHRIRRDSRQWIIQHPAQCPHAHRGPKGNYGYAKYTYLTSDVGFQQEVAGCHLTFPAAHPTGVSRGESQ